MAKDLGDADFDLTDDELDAECRVLATMLAGAEPSVFAIRALNKGMFGVPFHRAIFALLEVADEVRMKPEFDGMVAVLAHHPEFELFGGEHCLLDFAGLVSPESFACDIQRMGDRWIRRNLAIIECANERAAHGQAQPN